MSLTKVSYSMIQGALVNVLDYGAKGDGVADDTAAMQAAITAATNNGQSVLYIPTGTYIVKSQLNVSQCSVLGEGVYASKIKAGSGFTGTNLMYVGSLAQNLVYENFQLDGSTGTVNIKGLLIEGNVLHCRFSTIKISNCADVALRIKNGDGGTTRPSVNTFMDLRIITNDNKGLYYTSGRQNTFINCNFEEIGEEAIVCDGSGDLTDAPQSSTFEECWVERAGLNHLTSGGVSAVVLNTADNITLRKCLIDGYGSNPATTGHGIELSDSLFCTLEAPSIGFNRSGAATASSAPIRIQGGVRHRLIQLPSNLSLSNISVYAPSSDFTIKSAYNAGSNNGNQLFVANATTITGGTTNWVQPATGLVLASDGAARFVVGSRFTISRIWAEATTLPGPVGLLYSITVQKNGVDTGLVANLSDANSASSSTVSETTFTSGDTLSIKVVTSGGATTIPAGGLHIALAYMDR